MVRLRDLVLFGWPIRIVCYTAPRLPVYHCFWSLWDHYRIIPNGHKNPTPVRSIKAIHFRTAIPAMSVFALSMLTASHPDAFSAELQSN
jgi:hypothetical protein